MVVDVPGDPSIGAICRETTSFIRSTTSVGWSRQEGLHMGSVIKKRRKRMAKKKHRKLLRKTRVARRKAGK